MNVVRDVRYPEVRVPLVGEDGNAFAILGRVQKALRRAGVEPEEIRRFVREATADDYDHLLQTVMAWVTTGHESENRSRTHRDAHLRWIKCPCAGPADA